MCGCAGLCRSCRSWAPPPYHRVDKAAAVSDSTLQMFFFLLVCFHPSGGYNELNQGRHKKDMSNPDNGGIFHPSETTSKRSQIHMKGTDVALKILAYYVLSATMSRKQEVGILPEFMTERRMTKRT